MTPIMCVCHAHQVLYPAGERCPLCKPADRARANANQALGRNSQHWRRLSRRAIRAAGGVCPECGELEDPRRPATKLTTDLVGGGDHRRATLADVRVMCRACHGRADGGRRR